MNVHICTDISVANIALLYTHYMKHKTVYDAILSKLYKDMSKEDMFLFKLIQNWSEIVMDIATFTKPVKLNLKHNTLTLNVRPGFAMLIQYQHQSIKDNVNMFLGMDYVENVIIRQDLSYIE